MAIDSVKQAEYIYPNSTSSTSVSKASSAPNSVYDVQDNSVSNTTNTTNTAGEQKNNSKIEQKLTQLCEKLKKYNITIDEIRKNNLIYKISGHSEEELETSIYFKV